MMKSQFMIFWIGLATVALIGGCGGGSDGDGNPQGSQGSEPLGVQFAQMVRRDISVIRDQILDGGLPGGKSYSEGILTRVQTRYKGLTPEANWPIYVDIMDGFEKLIQAFDSGDGTLIEPQIDALIELGETLPYKPTLEHNKKKPAAQETAPQ